MGLKHQEIMGVSLDIIWIMDGNGPINGIEGDGWFMDPILNKPWKILTHLNIYIYILSINIYIYIFMLSITVYVQIPQVSSGSWNMSNCSGDVPRQVKTHDRSMPLAPGCRGLLCSLSIAQHYPSLHIYLYIYIYYIIYDIIYI